MGAAQAQRGCCGCCGCSVCAAWVQRGRSLDTEWVLSGCWVGAEWVLPVSAGLSGLFAAVRAGGDVRPGACNAKQQLRDQFDSRQVRGQFDYPTGRSIVDLSTAMGLTGCTRNVDSNGHINSCTHEQPCKMCWLAFIERSYDVMTKTQLGSPSAYITSHKRALHFDSLLVWQATAAMQLFDLLHGSVLLIGR
jgi:hypothetical protein